MVRIRKANYLDKFRLKKMISFLSNDAINHYTKALMNMPFNFIHDFLPLKMKFLHESHVLEEDGNIIGMSKVSSSPGNHFKLLINSLFL